MIYEIRTYSMQPGSIPEVVKRFGEAYEHRKKYSKIGAFWYTEIGPLNQIIHVWAYQSMEERTTIRAEAVKDENWPPPIGDYMVTQESELFRPFPGMPQFEPGTYGPIYEMRTYIMKPRMLPNVLKSWEENIGARMERSPVVASLYSEVGRLNKFVHIWPYASLNDRQEIRAKAVADGVWPPPGGLNNFLSQENMIMLPAPFSPMQ